MLRSKPKISQRRKTAAGSRSRKLHVGTYEGEKWLFSYNVEKGKDYPLGRYLTKMPKGWKVLSGATTAPKGYVWITNGKSHFGGDRKTALIKKNNK